MIPVRLSPHLLPRRRPSGRLGLVIGLALMAIALSALQGCTTLNAALNSGTATSMLIQDSVELGTQAVILHQPAATQAATAQQVIAAATAAEGVLQDSPTTVAQLDAQLAQLLAKTKLPAATQTLLTSVAALAVQQITAKVSAGALLSGAQAPLMTILSWIIQGATPYAGAAVAVADAQEEGAREALLLGEQVSPTYWVRPAVTYRAAAPPFITAVP